MANRALVLTAADEQLLMRMLSDVKNNRKGYTGRTSHSYSSGMIGEQTTPEMLIGVPDDTITARTGTTPGTGTCDIYTINESGTLTSMTSRSKDVYNLSTVAITNTSDHIPVVKTKHGKWLTFGAEGGDTSTPTLTQERIFAVKHTAAAIFPPGGSATMDLWKYTAGLGWYDTLSNVAVINTLFDCCLLQNEFGWAYYLEAGKYDLLPKGLSRRGQVDESSSQMGIAPGSTGTVNMIDHGGGSCAGVELSNHSVEACNGDALTNGHRQVFDNERVHIQYYEGVWHIINVPRIALLAQLAPEQDPDTNATGSSALYNIYDLQSGALDQWDSNAVTARNESGITHVIGKTYRIDWFGNSNEPLAFPWQITSCE